MIASKENTEYFFYKVTIFRNIIGKYHFLFLFTQNFRIFAPEINRNRRRCTRFGDWEMDTIVDAQANACRVNQQVQFGCKFMNNV